mmetsp:Transcript_3020/g.7305  ORF Transcript_3020/g.7305 Transcript_3020/m.7305 type:complete len:202 (-) Transcript_3020:81-686(-)
MGRRTQISKLLFGQQRAKERTREEAKSKVWLGAAEKFRSKFQPASCDANCVCSLRSEVLRSCGLALELELRILHARGRTTHCDLRNVNEVRLAIHLHTGVNLVRRSLKLELAAFFNFQLVNAESGATKRSRESPSQLRWRDAFLLLLEEVDLSAQHGTAPASLLLRLEDVAGYLVVVVEDLVCHLRDVVKLHRGHGCRPDR